MARIKKEAKTGNKKVNKKTSKKESKTMKKVMKKKEEKKAINFGPIRKMFNKILTKNKGLVLVENKHGAVQVKREGGLLFSARSDGKMIITHPMYQGKGKKKERVHKVSGTKWNHLSHVAFDDVTMTMLEDRIKDKKTASDYHVQFYGGKKITNSGLYQKAEAAKARAAKASKEAGKKKTSLKKEKKQTKKASNIIKRQAAKKPSKKGRKAISKVAAPAKA